MLSAPVNQTQSTNASTNAPFVLDASNSTSTKFTLAALGNNNGTETYKIVTLRRSFFEPKQAANVDYCITYDPNPPMPLPLEVQRCFTEVVLNSTANASDPSVHARQVFRYFPGTGVLELIWYSNVGTPSAASGNNVTNAADAPTPPQSTLARRYLGARQGLGDNDSEGSSTGAAEARNVTLVFTPDGPVVYAVQTTFDVAAFEPLDGVGASDNSTGNANTTSSANATETMSQGVESMSGSTTPTPSPSDVNASTTSAVSMYRAHVATVYAVGETTEVPSASVAGETGSVGFSASVTGTTTTATTTTMSMSMSAPTPSASAGSGTADPIEEDSRNLDADSQESDPGSFTGGTREGDGKGNSSPSPTSSGMMQMNEAAAEGAGEATATDGGGMSSASAMVGSSVAVSVSTTTVTVTESSSPSPSTASASSTPSSSSSSTSTGNESSVTEDGSMRMFSST